MWVVILLLLQLGSEETSTWAQRQNLTLQSKNHRDIQVLFDLQGKSNLFDILSIEFSISDCFVSVSNKDT